MDYTSLLRLVVGRDPKVLLDALLEYVQTFQGADSVALFSFVNGRPTLEAGRALAQPGLDWSVAAGKAERKRLERDQIVREERHVLAPLLRNGTLVAALYMETNRVDPGSIAEVAPHLLEGIESLSGASAPPSEVEDFLEQTPQDEIERRRLLVLLNRSEWNLARVARDMGVARKTIYDRLARYGIPRKKVQKSTYYWRRKVRGEM